MQNRTGKSGPVIILKAYRLNEVHSKMTMKSIVILSERSESKNLRNNAGAKIPRCGFALLGMTGI